MIYFLQMTTEPRLIKIGTTVRLAERKAQLQSDHGQPLTLLGVLSGGYLEEKDLHRQFNPYRHHGEWFAADGNLLGFIAAHAEPWTEELDAPTKRNDVPAKIDAGVIEKAKIVAAFRRTTLAEYLSDVLDPIVSAHLEDEKKKPSPGSKAKPSPKR